MTARDQLVTPTRRGLLTGMLCLVGAPAIVRASSLMAISPLPIDPLEAAGWKWDVLANHIRSIKFVVTVDPATGDVSMTRAA